MATKPTKRRRATAGDGDRRKPGLKLDTCIRCGARMLPGASPSRVTINGEVILVRGVPHLRCPECGETLTRIDAVRGQMQAALALYRERHGLLAGEEIRAIRRQHRLTQAQLAKLLGLGTNTLSRWEANRNVQTVAMDVLLRLVRDVPANLKYLRARRAG